MLNCPRHTCESLQVGRTHFTDMQHPPCCAPVPVLSVFLENLYPLSLHRRTPGGKLCDEDSGKMVHFQFPSSPSTLSHRKLETAHIVFNAPNAAIFRSLPSASAVMAISRCVVDLTSKWDSSFPSSANPYSAALILLR